MSDGIMLVFGEDGVAREYDDTWDITIHCESEEEQKAVWEKLNNLNREVKNLTDTISRQAAIDAIKALWNNAPSAQHVSAMFDCEDAIRALPSAQPERKKGKWINGVCDQCGSHAPYWAMASTYYRSSFCPNCGADMKSTERREG